MNSSIIHADIFFYITSISVVVVTIMLIVLFYYVVRIVRNVEHTSEKIKEESDNILEDISMIRESIEEQGNKFAGVLRFIFGSFLGSKRASNKGGGSREKKESKNKSKE